MNHCHQALQRKKIFKSLRDKLFLNRKLRLSIFSVLTILFSTMATAFICPANALQLNDEGEAVRRLQSDLSTAGFFNGSITGLYGLATESAVKDFQRSVGLDEDGIAGDFTLNSLAVFLERREPTVLELGQNGPEVAELQAQLIQAKVLRIPVPTGYYGSLTESAVKTFQNRMNLTEDGIAGPTTIAALRDFNRSHNNRTGVTPTQSTTIRSNNILALERYLLRQNFSSQFVESLLDKISSDLEELQRELKLRGFYRDQVDGVYGPLTETAIIAYSFASLIPERSNEPLRVGHQGDDVAELQSKLTTLGYYSGGIDGVFGPETEAAVINLQRNFFLAPDGIVGPDVRRRLQGISENNGDIFDDPGGFELESVY